MEKKYVFATGYPIGFTKIDNIEYYNVQLNGEIRSLPLLGTYVWLEGLKGGQTKLEILDNVLAALQQHGYEIGKDFKIEEVEMIYDFLLEDRLLIELSSDKSVTVLDKYPDLKTTKVGFGLGMDEDIITIHNDSKDVEIDKLEYIIWQSSFEPKTLKNIYLEYYNGLKDKLYEMNYEAEINEEELEIYFEKSFMSLYIKDLLYITSI